MPEPEVLQDSTSNAGWADFAPITLTVGVNETVALSTALSAGVSVPEGGSPLSAVPEASSALLASLVLFGLVGMRYLARRKIAV